MLLRTPPARFRTSNIAVRVEVEIGPYASTHGLGEVTTAVVGYVLECGLDTVGLPAVAFVRADRLPPPQEQNRFAQEAPDLAVEVGSPYDRLHEVGEEVAQDLALGVPLVQVFDPRPRTVTVRRPSRKPKVLHEGDKLDGDAILPGLLPAIGDDFRYPPMILALRPRRYGRLTSVRRCRWRLPAPWLSGSGSLG